MFDRADPWYRRVRELALALPGAQEKVSHGRPAFYTKKVFAYYSGSLKVDGVWVQHPQSVVLLADLDRQSALRAEPGAYVPGYLGAYGWTGLDLDDDTDLDDLADWIQASYDFTAPRPRASTPEPVPSTPKPARSPPEPVEGSFPEPVEGSVPKPARSIPKHVEGSIPKPARSIPKPVEGSVPEPLEGSVPRRRSSVSTSSADVSFLAVLAGGNPRTLAGVEDVLAELRAHASRVSELVDCCSADDPVVRMRAADALEKFARERPDVVAPLVDRLDAELSGSTQPSIQWHLAQLWGELPLSPSQRRRAADWLIDTLDEADDWIVLTCSMSALAALAEDDASLRPALRERLRRHARSRLPSVAKRATRLLATLG